MENGYTLRGQSAPVPELDYILHTGDPHSHHNSGESFQSGESEDTRQIVLHVIEYASLCDPPTPASAHTLQSGAFILTNEAGLVHTSHGAVENWSVAIQPDWVRAERVIRLSYLLSD